MTLASLNPVALKPCLVLGTGFHSWVLGARAQKSPMGSWHVLLDEVARMMGVSWSPGCGENPIFLWEKILHIAAQDGYFRKVKQVPCWAEAGRRKAYQIELDAKAAVAVILNSSIADYPNCSVRSLLPMREQWGAVLSLNFEAAWLQGAQKTYTDAVSTEALHGLQKAERKRLSVFKLANGKRIWFPNGMVDDSATLRLGLRDFGLQPSEIRFGFNLLKQFERNNFPKKVNTTAAVDWSVSGAMIEDYLDHNNQSPNPPLTWVADFIYRPLIFAGVALSQEELGLWWLLNQRQRNFAHLNYKDIPSAYVLIQQNDPRISFWQSHPFGVKPLVCSNWDQGWKMVEELIEKLSC